MIPELVSCLDRTIAFIKEQVADLANEDMVLQPEGVPNHAAWTLGHVICSCQLIAAELGVKTSLPDDWESAFGQGSKPSQDISWRSSKTALLAALEDASQRLRDALLEINEGNLADPLPNEKARELFPTIGHVLVQVIAGHMAYHAGQLATWRRAIGRKPVGVFV